LTPSLFGAASRRLTAPAQKRGRRRRPMASLTPSSLAARSPSARDVRQTALHTSRVGGGALQAERAPRPSPLGRSARRRTSFSPWRTPQLVRGVRLRARPLSRFSRVAGAPLSPLLALWGSDKAAPISKAFGQALAPGFHAGETFKKRSCRLLRIAAAIPTNSGAGLLGFAMHSADIRVQRRTDQRLLIGTETHTTEPG
jgi:hypothetical protein